MIQQLAKFLKTLSKSSCTRGLIEWFNNWLGMILCHKLQTIPPVDQSDPEYTGSFRVASSQYLPAYQSHK